MARKKKISKDYCRDTCRSLCCRDLAISITRPRRRDEIDDLKWQLHFDTVRVFIRNHRWYLLVSGRCMYLNTRNRCTIYDRRPEVCRKHNPPDCEAFGEYYDVMFTVPEALEAYLKNGGKKAQRL